MYDGMMEVRMVRRRNKGHESGVDYHTGVLLVPQFRRFMPAWTNNEWDSGGWTEWKDFPIVEEK